MPKNPTNNYKYIHRSILLVCVHYEAGLYKFF